MTWLFNFLFGFDVAEWLHIWSSYLLAAGLMFGGFWLAYGVSSASAWLAPLLRPLHAIGVALMIFGAAYGYGTYRESVGAADCMAEWKAKNYEAQLAALKRDADAKALAAEIAANQAKQLASQNDDANGKIADYIATVAMLSASQAACRSATADDVRRLCAITGNAAPGCQRAR